MGIVKRMGPFDTATFIASYLTGVVGPLIGKNPVIVSVSSGIKHGTGLLEENTSGVYSGFVLYLFAALFFSVIGITKGDSLAVVILGITAVHLIWTLILPIRRHVTEEINDTEELLETRILKQHHIRRTFERPEEVLGLKRVTSEGKFIEIIGCVNDWSVFMY